AGQDHGTQGRILPQLQGCLGQLRDHLPVNRIMLVRPIKYNGGYTITIHTHLDRLGHGVFLLRISVFTNITARSIAARSRPVCQPLSSSICTSGRVETFPRAPGAKGQPPNPPIALSKLRRPCPSATCVFSSA